VKSLRWQTWTLFLQALSQQLADEYMVSRMKTRFESKFRYDEQGVPRIWNIDDPIDVFYKTATDESHQLLTLFSKIDAPLSLIGDDVLEDEVLLLYNFFNHFLIF
jgi:protein SEY1